MDMKPADLALLLSLDALFEENNVTRAATRLHLSQPAVSAHLARLRDLFGDPLFLPAESGRGMIPTARALALRAPLQQALQQLRKAVTPPATFDPGSAERTFVVAANDNATTMFGVELAARVARQTQGRVRLRFRAAPATGLAEAMEQGAIDLLLGAARLMPETVKTLPLSRERYVAAQRKNHPRGTGALTLEHYCSYPHVLVSPGGDFRGLIDERLDTLGRSRHVAIVISHYNVAPQLLQDTDYLCTLPERFLSRHKDTLDLFPLPFELPDFFIAMGWHPRNHDDPGHRWLRGLLGRLD